MVRWTIYVQSFENQDDIISIDIDSESTFLELRKKAAFALNVNYNDLILASKVEYDNKYDSEKLRDMESADFRNESTLYAIHSVRG